MVRRLFSVLLLLASSAALSAGDFNIKFEAIWGMPTPNGLTLTTETWNMEVVIKQGGFAHSEFFDGSSAPEGYLSANVNTSTFPGWFDTNVPYKTHWRFYQDNGVEVHSPIINPYVYYELTMGSGLKTFSAGTTLATQGVNIAWYGPF